MVAVCAWRLVRQLAKLFYLEGILEAFHVAKVCLRLLREEVPPEHRILFLGCGCLPCLAVGSFLQLQDDGQLRWYVASFLGPAHQPPDASPAGGRPMDFLAEVRSFGSVNGSFLVPVC